MLKLLATDTQDADPAQGPIREKLGLVARAFVELQQARHRADYHSSRYADMAIPGNE